MKKLQIVIGVVGALFGEAAALAQTTDTTASRGLIEEIIVTARKREEKLSDVPTSITAFGGEDIDRLNLNTLDQLANFTPGLLVAEAAVSSGGSISLRGVGSGSSNYLTDQAVSINVDGMQVGSFHVRKNAQIDLQQIEVLRGPQALFFGKNSPGGVIAFKSKDPGQEREAGFTVGYETESQDKFYRVLYSAPITDRVGARIVAQYTDLEGFFDLRTVPANGNPLIVPPHIDSWPNGEEYFIRGTISAESTDAFRVLGKLSYSESNLEGGSITAFQRVDCPLGVPQLQPDFPCEADGNTFLGGAPDGAMDLVEGAPTSNGLGLRENEQWLSTFKMDYDLNSELTLTSLTGYYDFEEINAHNASVGPQATVLVPYLPFEVTQWTQELRLTSSWDAPINFMVGGFYEQRDTESSQNGVLTIVPGFLEFGEERFKQDQEAYSIFGNILWDITEALEFSVGLRYSHEEKDLESFFAGMDVTDNLAEDSISFDNVSPEVTVSYDITDEIMIFGSYKEGFKSGGFDAGFSQGGILTPGFENAYDEEQVDGFEVGLKANLSSGLAVNVTAYSYEYTDLQVSSFDADSITFKVQNAASSTVEGVEADFTWLPPVEGLTLRGSVAYNDAEFDDFFSSCYTGQTIAAGCNQRFDPATGAFLEQDLSGRQLHGAPEWMFTAGVLYGTQFSNGVGLDLSLNATYSDDYFANLRQSPQDIQDSYTKVNATLALRSPDDHWELAISGFNLTDEFTFSSSIPVTLTGGGSGTDAAVLADRSAVVSRGREVLVKLTYRL